MSAAQSNSSIPATMVGVVLTGYGGFERLEYRHDLPTPRPQPGEVLINVLAAGINNTDINTRTGWYNSDVTSGTTLQGGAEGFGVADRGMGAWDGEVSFPRVQGADVVGRIVAVGEDVDPARVGERVVCDPYCRSHTDDAAQFLGLDRDGGFAQFCVVPAVNAYVIPNLAVELDDAQLATLPCSAGTAVNMLLMASVGAGDRVIVTGASGGVGTFLVQIARHLGAEVAAIASLGKHAALASLGAHAINRDAPDPIAAARVALGGVPTVVADVVGGELFEPLIHSLGRGGRYVSAGAIAGPIVRLDLRTLYLRSLEFYGSATYRRDTFPTLMVILAEGGIRPIVHQRWPLDQIVDAQQAFLQRRHVGSMVLTPPRVTHRA